MTDRGPRFVVAVFKIFAGLSVLSGVLLLVALYANNWNSSNVGDSATVIVGGTVFTTAAFLFFAYVVELLGDIRDSADVLADAVKEPKSAPADASTSTEAIDRPTKEVHRQ